jgi:hypothetical protein
MERSFLFLFCFILIFAHREQAAAFPSIIITSFVCRSLQYVVVVSEAFFAIQCLEISFRVKTSLEINLHTCSFDIADLHR